MLSKRPTSSRWQLQSQSDETVSAYTVSRTNPNRSSAKMKTNNEFVIDFMETGLTL